MKRLSLIAALAISVVIVVSGNTVNAQNSQPAISQVEYSSQTVAHGIEFSRATIFITSEETDSAEYKWSIDSWVITANEINNYSIPDNSEPLVSTTKDTSTNQNAQNITSYYFNTDEVFNTAIAAGAIPNYKTGEVNVYAQPIIHIMKKDSAGNWNTIKENVRSLDEWVSAVDWKGVTSFKNFYNQKIRVRAASTWVSRAESDGKEISKAEVAINPGCVRSFEELGIKSKIEKDGIIYYLTGIEVKNVIDSTGKTTAYSTKLQLDDKVYDGDTHRLVNDGSFTDVDGRNVFQAVDGYVLGRNNNTFYDTLKDAKIRVGYNMSINAVYTALDTKVHYTGRKAFYTGSDSNYDIRYSGQGETTSKKPTLEDIVKFSENGSPYNLTGTVEYNGSNKWQLNKLTVARCGDTTSASYGEIVKQLDFDVLNTEYSKWSSKVDANKTAGVSLDLKGGTEYVVQGDYVINAPQIELKYYKDTEGDLHLISATSDGKDYSAFKDAKRNLYGAVGSTYSFDRYTTANTIEGTKDLVLTTAYAYEAPGMNSVAGYLSDTENCWTDSSTPTGGKIAEYTVDDTVMSTRWDCGDRSQVLQNSVDSAGLTKRLKLSVKSVPMNPLIYVSIYEECPEVYCISYVSADDSVTDSTVFTKYNAIDGTVEYDGIQYQRGQKVNIDIGHDSVDAYSVYSQDGIDDNLKTSGVQSADDVRGSITMGSDTIVYCTRYAWVTDPTTISKLLTAGDTVTYSQLKGAVGVLSDSSLGGRLYLRGGKGLLLKIFTPEIIKRDESKWAVAYIDKENGAGNSQSLLSSTFQYDRLMRVQLVGDFRNVIENSTSNVALQRNIAFSNQPDYEMELVNAAYSVNTTKIMREGSAEAGGGGNTNQYHSSKADNQAAELENDLEAKSYRWFNAPKSKTSVAGLGDVSNSFSWLQQQFRSENSYSAWNWYVYKYAKAINCATVLKVKDSTGKESYSTEQNYSTKKLNVYTTEYTCAYKPFIEDAESGKIFYLSEIVYGYTTENASVFDTSVFDKLKNSTSAVRGYHGGSESFNQNMESKKSMNSSGIVAKSDDTSITLKVDAKLLHVVGIYQEYKTTGASQSSPAINKEMISFRDTSNSNSSVTKVTVGSASVNDVKNCSTDARFNGNVTNDQDNSSDNYVASTAIPTTEYLQTSASVPQYLTDLDFTKNTVTMSYELNYCKAFYSEIVSNDRFGNEVVVYNGECHEAKPKVKRSAVNYSLYGSTIWYPSDSTIWNYALPEKLGQHVIMIQKDVDWISDLGIETNGSAEFMFPNYTDPEGKVNLQFWDGVELVSNLSSVKYDSSVKVLDAESRVGDILATNQEVKFNDGTGKEYVLLEKKDSSITVSEPVDAPAAVCTPTDIVAGKNDCVSGTFSSKNNNTKLPWNQVQASTVSMSIDAAKDNGIYSSTGIVRYITDANKIEQHGITYSDVNGNGYSAVDNGICYALNVNDVTLLTPALVTVAISDESDMDQSISTSVGYPLVLDRPFTIATSAIGSFCNLPGYGEKNYARYLNTMENSGQKAIRVRFPFVVVKVTETGSNIQYDAIPANTWMTVGLGNVTFMLPTFVEEADFQTIEVRAYALNITKQSQMTKIEYSQNNNLAALSNRSVKDTDSGWDYVAQRDITTATKGRVYGLKIVDVAEYPLWEDVFRDKNKNLTGASFFSGLANQNGLFRGNLSNRVFPIVSGDHPKYSNEGFMRLGYKVRFELDTVGSMYSADDIVEITPEFYWVDESGANRTRVDLYYDKDVNGKTVRGIKVGSEQDNSYLNYYNLSNGKFSIDSDRLNITAKDLGYTEIGSFIERKTPIYNFSQIQLNQYVRIFSGDVHTTDSTKESVLLNGMIMDSGKGLNIPESIIERSTQKWYGQYYLPTNLHVTDKKESEVKSNPKWMLYEDNQVWKSDGYLIVNFNITTVNHGMYSLTYDADSLNAENGTEWHCDAGHCDMWSVEMAPKVKQASDGVTFNLQNGDFLIYDVKDFGNDATNGYSGGGTH